jgi:hypothetical protein
VTHWWRSKFGYVLRAAVGALLLVLGITPIAFGIANLHNWSVQGWEWFFAVVAVLASAQTFWLLAKDRAKPRA